jgi:hypothetical protein
MLESTLYRLTEYSRSSDFEENGVVLLYGWY